MPIGHKNVKSALPPRWLKVAILSFSDIFLIDKGPLADSSQKWPIPLKNIADSSKKWPIPRNRPIQNRQFSPLSGRL